MRISLPRHIAICNHYYFKIGKRTTCGVQTHEEQRAGHAQHDNLTDRPHHRRPVRGASPRRMAAARVPGKVHFAVMRRLATLARRVVAVGQFARAQIVTDTAHVRITRHDPEMGLGAAVRCRLDEHIRAASAPRQQHGKSRNNFYYHPVSLVTAI